MSTVISALPYSITTSGHYVLTNNIASETGAGISVSADDVTIDLCGFGISTQFSGAANGYGVSAFNKERITVKNGSISGFMYGVYLSDLADAVRPNGSFDGGGHTLKDLDISRCTFRGIRIEGNGNVVRNNTIREIGGCTLYQDAYAFGVESFGPGALIECNRLYEVRGGGVADIGEGVGISISDFGDGSVIRDNVLMQSSREISRNYTDWPAESRSSYGIWIGGESDVMVDANLITNFVYGITYKRTARGLFCRNRVNNAVAPYYLPTVTGLTLAIDGGGNMADIHPEEFISLRVTPGQTEYVEQSYLAPRA